MKLFPQMYTAATIADLRLVKPENARRVFVHSTQFQMAYCAANDQTYRYNSGSTDADDGFGVVACDDGGTWERVDASGDAYNQVWVDGVRGNDSTGQLGGLPFKTINAALAAIGALATADQDNWVVNIAAGTYSQAISIGGTDDTLFDGLVLKGDGPGRTILTNAVDTDTITVLPHPTALSINWLTFQDLTIQNTSAVAGTYAVEIAGGAVALSDLFRSGICLFDNCWIVGTQGRGLRATCCNILVFRSCVFGAAGAAVDIVFQEVSQLNMHDVFGSTITIRYDADQAAVPLNGRALTTGEFVNLTGALTLNAQPYVEFDTNCVVGDIAGVVATAATAAQPSIGYHGRVNDDILFTYTIDTANAAVFNFDNAVVVDDIVLTDDTSDHRVGVNARWAQLGGSFTFDFYCDVDVRHSNYTAGQLFCLQADPGDATRPTCNRSVERYTVAAGDWTPHTVSFVDGAAVRLEYPDTAYGVIANDDTIADLPLQVGAPSAHQVVITATADPCAGALDVTIVHP